MQIYCEKNGEIETSDWFLKNHAECERKAYHANILGIEPRELPADSPLTIGDCYHEALESIHAEMLQGVPPRAWADIVDQHFGSHRARFEGGATHPRDVWGATFHFWLVAMILGLLDRWPADQWAESYPETWFRQPLHHPETGEKLIGVKHKGAVDLLLRSSSEFVWGDSKRFRLPAECAPGWYLKECKSAAKVDDAYIGRLIADDQITMYAHHLGRERGITIEGILYEVTIKPPKKSYQLEPDESDMDFRQRKERAEKEARAGKMGNRLRLKIGETQEELKARKIEKGLEEVKEMKKVRRTDSAAFAARLAAFYKNPDRFVRVFVPLRPEITRNKLMDQYIRAQRIRDSIEALKSGEAADQLFIRSWGSCWPQKGRCEFWSICTSSTPDIVMDEGFVRRKARETAARHVIREMMESAPDADEDF